MECDIQDVALPLGTAGKRPVLKRIALLGIRSKTHGPNWKIATPTLLNEKL